MVKRILIALITLIAVGYNLNAQSSSGNIEVTKDFGGFKYKVQGKDLTRSQLSQLLEKDKEAFRIMKRANTNNTFATIIGGAGGFLIGFPIGSLIVGKEPAWGIAAIGGALALISFPLDIAFKKQTKEAVDLYNSNLTSSFRNEFNPSLRVEVNKSAVAVLLKF